MESNSTKASTAAKNRYNAKVYDSLRIVVKKGRKAKIQAHAEARGESLNAFVGRAISETMERDRQQEKGVTKRDTPAAQPGDTTKG